MRIRLAQKIIIAVAVPVIFQLAFLFPLIAALHDFAQVQALERESTQVLVLRDRLYLTDNHRLLLSSMYQATKKPVYREHYAALAEDIKSALRDLTTLWQGQPEKLKAIDFTRQAENHIDYLTQISWQQNRQKTISDLLGGQPGIWLLRLLIGERKSHATIMMLTPIFGKNTQGLLDHLFSEEERKQAGYEKDVTATEDRIIRYLLCASIASVLISLLSGLFFTWSISKRLKVILKNTKLLASSSDKLATIGGTDEIFQLNESIQHTARKLHQAEEFQAQTIQIIADELQKPLGLVSETLTNLQKDGFVQISEKGAMRLTNSTREISRLRALVNELAFMDEAIAAGPTLDVQLVDLRALADDAIGIVREFALSKGINIVLTGDSVSAQCDRNRVLQVTVNLLSNAMKFSPADSKIEVGVTSEKGFGKISVRDYGPGIGDESKHRIFQKFEQVEAADGTKRAGTGLGLVISKELVEAQHGSMDFASKSGEGSTFWLTLPMPETNTKNHRDNLPKQVQQVSETNDTWKPTLWRKVLTIVLLPLLVQLGTIGILWSEMNSVSETIEHYNLASQISSIHAKLLEEIVRSTFFAMIYNVEKDADSRQGYNQELARMKKNSELLVAITVGNPKLQENAKEVQKAIQLNLKVQTEIMNANQDADAATWFGGANGARTEALLMGTEKPLQESIEHEWRIIDSSALASEGTEKKIELILLISSILIGILSIVLGLYMVRKIRAGIKTLLNQTIDFSEQRIIPPLSEGTDELAFLGNSFRSSAIKLIELEQIKSEMVAITSHELRTPLTSLMALTELIENRVFGELTDQGIALLNSAQTLIEDLITMITDLLDLEKMQSGRLIIHPKLNDVDEIMLAAKENVMKAAESRQVVVEPALSNLQINMDRHRIVQSLSALMRVLVENLPAGSKIELHGEKNKLGLNLIMSIPPTPVATPNSAPSARERLAISLTRLVAEQHGGMLSITRIPAGRIITINIPDAEEAA